MQCLNLFKSRARTSGSFVSLLVGSGERIHNAPLFIYGLQRSFSKPASNGKKPKSDAPKMLRNEQVPSGELRVVWENEEGENQWKILSKTNALKLAREMNLDLLLMNGKAVPPVCKLGNYGVLLMEKKTRVKEIKKKEREKAQKEMLLKAGIDLHDFETKMKRVKEFLEDGHPVKIVIQDKKKAIISLKKNMNALGIEETTLMMLESIESLPIVVHQMDDRSGNNSRREFNLLPKAKNTASGGAAPPSS
jgi:translation initiation factor IF-3